MTINLIIPDYVIEALESRTSIKMIGTVGYDGNIDLVPVEEVKAVEKDVVEFCYSINNNGEKAGNNNVKVNVNASLAVFEPEMIGFQLKGALNNTAGAFRLKINGIYALTMAVAGEKIA